MIKNGFTLAEVLITLAIIGVVASLTLPNLNVNVQKQQVGPALAKAVNTLENANKLALTDNNARRLDELEKTTNYLNSLSSVSWREHDVTKSKILGTYTKFQKATNKICNTSKDGIQYCVSTTESNAAFGKFTSKNGSNTITTYSRYVDIYIDVNGDKAPNTEGTDVFRFRVENDGSVIAFGSREYKQRYGGGLTWESGGCDSNKVTPKRPGMCSGSIVDNGFKVIY